MNSKKDITIYDIADKLNLSSATVSRALRDNPAINKNTRTRIQQTAKRMGYRHNNFASNLRNQKTHSIGVIMHELNSNFMTSVLAGIEKVISPAGYDIIIAHSSENYQKEIANAHNLFHKRVDGLIASLAFDTQKLDHYLPFSRKGIPVIFYDRVEENSDWPHVIIDNQNCGYLATRHLIDQGCQKIALITSNLERNVYWQRHKGYQRALKEAGLPCKKEWVVIKDLSENKAVEAALQLLKMDPLPDGVFITNDFSAAVCMQTLKQYGIRIPEDMAIVGFNNDAIGKLVAPQLTTINYPGNEIGEVAARTLINHLNGVADIKQMKTIIVRSELIVRGSSLKKKSNNAKNNQLL